MDVMDYLGLAGFEAITAYNADEAIRILEGRNDIRAVVTDIDIPSMDGLKLAEAVRYRWPPIELIVRSCLVHLSHGRNVPRHGRQRLPGRIAADGEAVQVFRGAVAPRSPTGGSSVLILGLRRAPMTAARRA